MERMASYPSGLDVVVTRAWLTVSTLGLNTALALH